MLADLPLPERQRRAADDQGELRAALARRHFDVMDGQQLVADGALANNLHVAAIIDAKLRAMRAHAKRVPTVPPIDLVSVAQPDLRARLGLS